MEIEVKIEKLGAQGDGVALHNGLEIFVPFSVPGETVRGEIVENRITKPTIVTPVGDRIKAPCSHFKTCGGCSTQHITPAFLAEWKQQIVVDALKKVDMEAVFKPIITSPVKSRRRAVLSGKRTKNGAMLGFHGRASHAIVPITNCHLIDQQITNAFDGLEKLVVLAATRKSVVRVNVTTSEGGLDIELGDATPLDVNGTQQVSTIAHEHNFARVLWNGEVILVRRPAHQKFGTALVSPPSGSFLQATKEGESALVAAVKDIVLPAKKVADLFSGCGTFTLPLAEHTEVLAVESSAEMLQSLDTGWRQAQGLKRVQVEKRDLFRNPLQPDELRHFDAVVLDPPRAGSQAQVDQIAQSSVNKIAFVSCNPATFARDARTLVDAGFSMDWVQVVDQFLWSGHCELVAKFSRNPK